MTDHADIDVLVVDDTSGAAEDYASIIAAGTGLVVEATDDPEAALALIHERNVKILVLDQKMPTPGTELFAKAREISDEVRAIMLTGEATPAEVGDAMTLGFSKYIAKGNIRDTLVPAVRHEYAVYQTALAAEDGAGVGPVVLHTKSSVWPWARDIVSYRVRGLVVVKENYVFEEEWVTLASVHVGQSERVVVDVKAEKEVVLDAEAEQMLTAQLGLSPKQIAGFVVGLKKEIRTQTSASVGVRQAEGMSVERTFELPAEPSDPDQVHVRMRRVKAAPAYKVLRVEVHAECTACNRPHLSSFNLFASTGKRAIQQEDYLSNGQHRIHRLGYE